MPANPEEQPILKPSDMEKYPFTPRLFPRDIPSAGIFDSPDSVHAVNKEWRAHIMGHVEGLQRRDAWNGTDAQIDDAIRAVEAFIHGSECGVQPMLRQKPENPCIMQQSINGGDTWSDVFDFSLCQSPTMQALLSLQFNAVAGDITFNQWIANNFTTVYATYPMIAPTMTTATTEELELARCHWARRIVDTVAEGYAVHAETTGDQLQVIGALMSIASFLIFPSKFSLELVGAITKAGAIAKLTKLVGLVTGAIGWTINGTAEQYRNQDARHEVACWLADWIANNEPTQLAYALIPPDATFTGDADVIGRAVLDSNADEESYNSSMHLYALAVEASREGIIPPCSCDPPTTTSIYSFNFTTSDGGWYPVVANRATYINDEGWARGSDTTYLNARVDLPATVPAGTYRFRWQGSSMPSTLSGTTRGIRFRLSGTIVQTISMPNLAGIDYDEVLEIAEHNQVEINYNRTLSLGGISSSARALLIKLEDI